MHVWYLWDVILGDEPIGKMIQEWRINLGMSQAEGCRRSGIGQDKWSRIESGQTSNPSFETIIQMFKAMNAVVDVKTGSYSVVTQPQLPLGGDG